MFEKLSRTQMLSYKAEVVYNDLAMKESDLFLNHAGTGVRSDKLPSMSPIGVANNFQLDVICGKIQIYGHLNRLSGSTAFFSDGSFVEDIDAIVYCSGFKPDLSIVEEEGIIHGNIICNHSAQH
ncbi:uncharacterized protein LOC101861251 [Aplysia californica]|uniref:Flavin-containing monooxygenase n=1 Tax=Aplysia californica TaxID=6500 RepID=A0ABM0JBQ5_APLCA|nr:uncharacterized protein LOC101861251 [Aplysia californica]